MINKIYAFLMTLFIFSLFFEIITPKNQELVQSNNALAIEETSSLAQVLNEEQRVRMCRDSITGFNDEAEAKKLNCRKKRKLELQNNNKKLFFFSLAIIHAFKTASAFIIVIYLTLFLTLWIQFYLFFQSKTILSNKEQILVEWNINVPPILGVVGTIYSFASFTLIATEQKGLFDIFKNNFYDAATTTIIGGSFYVINFALAIWIFSKLDSKE